MWRLYFLMGVLTGYVDPITGYSDGEVSVACGDMVPQHGYEPSPDPPPYNITVDKSTYRPGDNITVYLQVASSFRTFFKGFLIEARDAGKLTSSAVGSFILTDPLESQLLLCGHTQGSGVSHRRSTKKTHVQALWVAPKDPPQRVGFLVTVVHEYKVYWVRIPGPVVSLRGATAAPPTTVHAPTTSPRATAGLSTPFSSVGCSHNKSCLRDPAGCHPESDPHCFFLSFITDQEASSVIFELSGPAEGYVSFALSLDKWMGNDDVYLCVNDGGRVTISAAHVTGRTHPELETQEDLWGQAWRLADGVIQCRFQRNILLPQRENRFSLNQSYFLFLAHGRSQQGVLMLTAWMWTVSSAVFIARHYKHLWPDTTLLGQRLWFQRAGSHPYIGCTVMALSVIQPIMAILRPAPESPRRFIFSWMHFAAGTVCQILAGKTRDWKICFLENLHVIAAVQNQDDDMKTLLRLEFFHIITLSSAAMQGAKLALH
ncbi:Ferric-chelate reductase 1 [Nibea albiflora]|uniref:Ferric-chelate reductase 1 n=1 Tax=Nibea albiflora TaxID=240163 RepID=A0ACB7F531_NIBAL|nr:Ferric-chelate reductase 1 [Nibea albiflora]